MCLWRFEVQWPSSPPPRLDSINLLLFLNHTSLFDPVFLAVVPFSGLWFIARRMVAPGAQKTLDRPLVGMIYKFLFPQMVSITRKRDFSWDHFLNSISSDNLIVIAPEGRMKRRNGLDADGKPMSVRGGVADILSELTEGKMLLVFSGGLHHIQAPGERRVHFFRTIKVKIEIEDIAAYKKQILSSIPFAASSDIESIKTAFTAKVIEELNNRLRTRVPT